MKRRQFLRTALAGSCFSGTTFGIGTRAAETAPATPADKPLVVSTWGFGKAANDVALKILQAGGSLLDAVERGIGVVESDPGNPSVGLGGTPNAAGVVQLDAAIMSGPGHHAGGVAALEGIRHPISAARRVMERPRMCCWWVKGRACSPWTRGSNRCR